MSKPNEYSKEIADKIILQITEGGQLSKICEADDMPLRTSFYRWMETRADLKDAYTRAREAWADFYEERVIAIAFDDKGDFFIEDGKAVADHARVARARLQVDTLKWFMSKWAPRRYGDKPELPPEPAQAVHRIVREIVGAVGGTTAPEPPRQLTFAPTPLPADLSAEDWSIIGEVVRLLKATIPSGDDRPPAEIFGLIRDALLIHFRS